MDYALKGTRVLIMQSISSLGLPFLPFRILTQALKMPHCQFDIVDIKRQCLEHYWNSAFHLAKDDGTHSHNDILESTRFSFDWQRRSKHTKDVFIEVDTYIAPARFTIMMIERRYTPTSSDESKKLTLTGMATRPGRSWNHTKELATGWLNS